jgi:hypothetical protein
VEVVIVGAHRHAADVILIFYTMMEEVIHFHGVAVLRTA